jgi:hypothetical protein
MPNKNEVFRAHMDRIWAEAEHGEGSPEQELYEHIALSKQDEYETQTGRKFGQREG